MLIKRTQRKHSRWLLVPLVLMASVSLASLKYLADAGAFRQLSPHGPDCEVLAGFGGAEDIAITSQGYAFVSTLGRSMGSVAPGEGRLLGIDLNNGESSPVVLSQEAPSLQPRGLALFESTTGTSLMLVNYRSDGYAIELFSWRDGRLEHSQTVRSPHLHQPGAIAAVGHERFYVANERGLYTASGVFLEDILHLRTAEILYFDGHEFHTVAKELARPSGLYVEGDRLFVAEMNAKSISVYQRDRVHGELTKRETIDLGSFTTSVQGDGSGDLWVTAQPQLLSYQSYAASPSTLVAPSQVFHLAPQPEERPSFLASEYLLTVTGPLSAASVASPYRNHLLLGSAFEDKLLKCPAQRQDLARSHTPVRAWWFSPLHTLKPPLVHGDPKVNSGGPLREKRAGHVGVASHED